MSDFDKEAEREKLREKYGEREDKRDATEQMSELLLKGATMTNAHCTDGGDTIFRYDGQEFCPTCQKPVAREGGETDDNNIEVTDPSDDATVQFGGDTDATSGDSDATPAQPAADTPAQQSGVERTDRAGTDSAVSDNRGPSADPDRSAAAPGGQELPTEGTPTSASTAPSGGERSELATAESLLVETIHRFTQRAAETDDPRRAREYLSAAREAAETLDAVRF